MGFKPRVPYRAKVFATWIGSHCGRTPPWSWEGSREGSTNRVPCYTLTFALQQSKMTGNIGESSYEVLGTNSSCCRFGRLIVVLDWTAYFQSLSTTDHIWSCRLRSQAPLVGPWSAHASDKLPNKGFPAPANFETKPPVVPWYKRRWMVIESKGRYRVLKNQRLGHALSCMNAFLTLTPCLLRPILLFSCHP